MMSLRRLLAISRKEFHHVTRDPRILPLVLIALAFLFMMLAYVFAFDVDCSKMGNKPRRTPGAHR